MQERSTSEFSRDERMRHGQLEQTMWWLLWPAMFGAVTHAAFQATDMYYVARLGTAELAAVGAANALEGVYNAIGMSMATAIGMLAAGRLGAGDRAAGRVLIGHALLFGIALAIVTTVAGLLLLDASGKVLSVPTEAVPHYRTYLQIRLPGFVAVLLLGNVGAALRATGDTRTPVVISIAAASVNLALTPALAYGIGPVPRLGVAGAAAASVACISVAAAVSLWVLIKRERLVEWTVKGISRTIVPIQVIATPAFIGIFVYIGLRSALMALAGTLGASTAAAVAAGLQIEMLGGVPMAAAGAIVLMFMGYNIGAQDSQRASDAVLAIIRVTLFAQCVIFGLLALLARPVAALYSHEPDVQRVFTLFIWTVAVSHIPLTIGGIVSRGLMGFGRLSTYLQLTAWTGVLSLPVHVAMARSFGLAGLLGSILLCRSGAGIAAWMTFARVQRKLNLARGALFSWGSSAQKRKTSLV